jgi:hypothetical protein
VGKVQCRDAQEVRPARLKTLDTRH